MEKLPLREKSQNKGYYLTTELSSLLILFPESAEISKC